MTARAQLGPRATLKGPSAWETLRKVLRPVVVHGFLILASLIMALPFIWMVLSSLKAQPEIFIFPPRWLPKTPLWSNYIEVTKAMPFTWFTYNSLKIAVLTVLGQILSASLAAYAFARLRFPGREVMFLTWLGCMMIPGQVTLIPQFILFRSFGWLDTHLPLVIPSFFGSAFGTFLLRQFFMTIPMELEDAAIVDGCTRFRIYWNIMMPLAKPALATLAVFTFMGSWNSLLEPVVYLTTYRKLTLPVGLAFFRGQYTTNWALLMAGATLSVVPIIALYIFAQKYFVQGVVMSGIKG
ncbi:MAG: carbohydrate ABC transporter permease [Anaerolineae bacterium]|nr:carbohydrate ABC transporter permease [Anaerolineae bacterium]